MSLTEKRSEPRYETYDLFASARRLVFPSPRRKRDTQRETCSLAAARALTPSHSCSRIDRNHESLFRPAIRGENVGADGRGGRENEASGGFLACRCLDDFQRRLYWIFTKCSPPRVQRFVLRQILNLCPITKKTKKKPESTQQ